MNRTRKIQILSALAAAILTTTAQADELLPQAHYTEQLARCVAEIRSELSIPADERLQHRVTDISKENIWYTFAIETSDGDTIATSSCRAWRFEDRASVAVQAPAASATQLAENR